MKASRAWIGWMVLAACTLPGAAPAPTRPSLERLVAARRAVEEVYWRHRVWPEANGGAKPALGAVMSAADLRAKVTDALRKSAALERYWRRPITSGQLQSEIDRMAAGTKSPEILRELFAALGNDPALVAETLARPLLADRLIRSAYASDDQMHGFLRARVETAIASSPDLDALARTGGDPSEVTFVRRDARRAPPDATSAAAGEVVLEPDAWDALVEDLGAAFGVAPAAMGRPGGGWPAGRMSRLQEDADRFSVSVIRRATDDEIALASIAWPKRSFDEWWVSVRDGLPATVDATQAVYHLREVAPAAACDDQWTEVHRALPEPRSAHTAVWTGSEMIVWGASVFSREFGTGDRYNPATDTWSRVRSDATAPENRSGHVAVWTGTEMIVWGGLGPAIAYLNSGGRYNPTTDTWTPTRADATAPAARYRNTAVWTGTEMIVWGGFSGTARSDGGRYDPADDTWSPTRSDATTPTARFDQSAVWTGTEMIVWGGSSGDEYHPGFNYNTGGRYDPTSDTWTPTPIDPATPSARREHAVVWTGSEMIAWGGSIWQPLPDPGRTVYFEDGARYDPAANRWTAMSAFNAPTRRARAVHAWTGSEMIIFGGVGVVRSDMRYDPASDSWSTMADYPSAFGPRPDTGVWTGSELIVWGGTSSPGAMRNLGGRYAPATDSWLPTPHDDTPTARIDQTAVWTGAEMIVWGGRDLTLPFELGDGARYDRATDSWTRTRLDGTTPSARYDHTAVWTGSEMIVWGGNPAGATGARYNPASDTWTPVASPPDPPGRIAGTAIWTGSRMIVWGGTAGGLYDPVSDSWVPMRAAPIASGGHTAVWTGSEMIIWGGFAGGDLPVNSGARYNPTTDSWVATSITGNTPSPRALHSAVWTGSEMIVFGGSTQFEPVPSWDNIGGAYDPRNDSWRATSQAFAPAGRRSHSAVWTGREMIVWGGAGPALMSSGGRYEPTRDAWLPTRDDATTPSDRGDHSAVWTGSEMIVWGGNYLDTAGGAYCPGSSVPGTPVVSACVTTSSPLGKGSGTISWRTDSETGLLGFNVVTLDAQGNRTQVNPALIACGQCVTGLGAAYTFILPKHRSGNNFYIESVRNVGVVERFGPATKGCGS